MAENSKIEWCHHTMNFWVGCEKLSPACDHCYAEAWAKRTGHPELWTGERRRTSAKNWEQPYKWNREAKAAGERRRVFSLSLADFFDNQVDASWRADAWRVIAECDALDWLILTKRPQNIDKMLPIGDWWDRNGPPWPWPHVWLGVTAENQEEADRRIPILLDTPAAVRFISAEPLLGPLDLRKAKLERGHITQTINPLYGFGALDAYVPRLNWVICGGESGPGARPMHPGWARSLRDQCVAAGVAFHFKQNGEFASVSEVEGPGAHHHFPDGATVRRVGKKAAGRTLDGRTWDEFPE